MILCKHCHERHSASLLVRVFAAGFAQGEAEGGRGEGGGGRRGAAGGRGGGVPLPPGCAARRRPPGCRLASLTFLGQLAEAWGLREGWWAGQNPKAPADRATDRQTNRGGGGGGGGRGGERGGGGQARGKGSVALRRHWETNSSFSIGQHARKVMSYYDIREGCPHHKPPKPPT